MVAIPQLSYVLLDWITYIDVLTLVLVIVCAPFDTYEEDLYIKRKSIATIIVSSNLCFHFSPIISIAFAVQAIDLIKFGSVFKRG